MRITIRSKIIGCILTSILFVVIGAILLARRVVSEDFAREILRTGHVATQYLAERMVTPLLTNDLPAIKLIIYRIKQENRDIKYIFLIDQEGQVMASTLGRDAALKTARLNPIPPVQGYSIGRFHTRETGIYDVAYQLLKSDVGELHIGFSDKRLQDTLNNFNNTFLLIISLICSLGLGLAIYVAKHITAPLESLAHKMCQVSQGNLAVSIDKLPNDEIGLLGQNFNQMIGDLKRSREQIELYNPVLKQMARERTAAHDQLVQASKLAAIGQLAAGVSHELNAPLGGILRYSQFILKTGKKKGLENLSSDELKNIFTHVGYIERGSQHCKAIVDNLLKFSRASKTQMAPLNINQVLEETFIFTQHQLEIHQVELVQKLAQDLLAVMGNEHQLQQVFTEIMLNAQQAIPQGGKLTVSTAINNGLVQIAFADTGCGIPKEHLDKLFDPFFTTKEAKEGTGLGLSVSYLIIQAHQGKIEVESEVGKGTIFRIKLPIRTS